MATHMFQNSNCLAVACTLGSLLLLFMASTSAAPPNDGQYKHAACRIICQSDTLRLAEKLCPCFYYQNMAAMHKKDLLEEYLRDGNTYNNMMDKRWGLDMDMGMGDMGNMAWTVDSYDPDAEEDDARKIFRFGKRSGNVKKWSLEDDMSMALPWEHDGAVMSNEDRAGGKIFRFGKRNMRSSSQKVVEKEDKKEE